MKNLYKQTDGSFTIVLHLKPDEKKQLKKLSRSMNMNDFDAIKYAVKLVSWWSRNQIEPSEEE